MIIGLDFFGDEDGTVFETTVAHSSYNQLEIYNGIIDHLYVDEDISIPYSILKPTGFEYQTVLNANFNGNIEGGSITANNLGVQSIKFQKRKIDELQWTDVAEIPYIPDQKLFYEAIDKYIANDFTYEYSLIPITETVLGNRVSSSTVTAKFEGVFISDKDSNYQLLYDMELSDINHNTPSQLFEPLNARYPIISYSNLDYTSFDTTATFVSAATMESAGNKFDIRMERLGKDQLFKFMKNRRPKVYRDINGNLKLVTVVGSPREIPNNSIAGLAKMSFQLVEIGDMDSETLLANNLLEGLSEV